VVLTVLSTPGEVLKESRKSRVERIGGWVIKRCVGPFLSRSVRLTFRRNRYRRGWRAALHLERHGVPAPRAVAYVEKGFGGLLFGNAFIAEYLDGARNVEEYARAMISGGAGPDAFERFLASLADAVNDLNAAGAYHGDLSGKNIFTRDGETFHFIDLDAVEIGAPYTDERRLASLIQLYDSFCDELSDALLAPFVIRMLPPGQDPRVWLPRVREGQAARRARLERRRERQRRSDA